MVYMAKRCVWLVVIMPENSKQCGGVSGGAFPGCMQYMTEKGVERGGLECTRDTHANTEDQISERAQFCFAL